MYNRGTYTHCRYSHAKGRIGAPASSDEDLRPLFLSSPMPCRALSWRQIGAGLADSGHGGSLEPLSFVVEAIT